MIEKSQSFKKYAALVKKALAGGHSAAAIASELQREKSNINRRCMMKQAELSQDRNIYKTREAARAARECLVAIDFLIAELTAPKETTI